jgi:enoyl-CoA hydratase/carnithine racemase
MGGRSDVKLVLISASGDAFCLGRSAGSPGGAAQTPLAIRSEVAEPILSLYADIRATETPVIAIVQGEAKGFGCALIGVCDLAIASEAAVFSMPEMDGNLPPTLAMSAVLGKLPPKQLLHMVYTREKIDAASALAFGLVSQLALPDELEAAAERMIGLLVDRSRPALCAVKEYMGAAAHLDPAAAARLAANTISVVLGSAAAKG